MSRAPTTVLLLLFFCFAFVACGDDDGENGENDSSNATENQSSTNDGNAANTGNDGNASNQGNGSNHNANSMNHGNASNDGNGSNNNSSGGPTFCRNTCQEASECGAEAGWDCVDERCVFENGGSTGTCSDDEECVAFLSGWHDPCSNQDGCAPTQACIEHQGEGLCAFEHGEFIDCHDMDRQITTLPRYGDAGDADVCVHPSPLCHPDHGFCMEGCQSDADCFYAGVDTCVDGLCQCGSDAACDDVSHGDVCFDGHCGCSGDQVCIDGGFDVCE